MGLLTYKHPKVLTFIRKPHIEWISGCMEHGAFTPTGVRPTWILQTRGAAQDTVPFTVGQVCLTSTQVWSAPWPLGFPQNHTRGQAPNFELPQGQRHLRVSRNVSQGSVCESLWEVLRTSPGTPSWCMSFSWIWPTAAPWTLCPPRTLFPCILTFLPKADLKIRNLLI